LCSLFDFVPELQFWIKDPAGRYCHVNRGFLLNYGLDRVEQAIGKTDYDLSPRHIADQFRFDDERVLTGQEIHGRVELVGRFDHTALWCVTTKIPLRSDHGDVLATAGITIPLAAHTTEVAASDVLIGKVVAFVRAHYAERITGEQLAHVARISVRSLQRRFRRVFGMSPHEYLRRVRVRLACYEVVHSQAPFSAIAARHGFADQSHFCREFRRLVGQTPLHYRLQYQRPAGE
jgi:AraC-like DNA-binding protein